MSRANNQSTNKQAMCIIAESGVWVLRRLTSSFPRKVYRTANSPKVDFATYFSTLFEKAHPPEFETGCMHMHVHLACTFGVMWNVLFRE